MPKIEKYVTESLGAEVLVRSTNQPQTSYIVAASLSEFELKKILIDKMETNKSIDRSDVQKDLYKALVESYNSDKDIISLYGDVVTLKRSRDDQDKDEDLFARSNRGPKRRRSGKETESSKELTHKESKSTSSSKGDDDAIPAREILEDASQWNPPSSPTLDREWQKTKTADKRLLTNDHLNHGSHNWLKLQAFNLRLMNKVSRIWSPIKVIYDKHAYWGTYHWGPKRQKFYEYATHMESSKDVYSKHRIIAVTSLKIMQFFGYSHLEEIIVRRQDDQLYKFREGDFKRLHRKDIKDMLLLLVQERVEDLQLGIKSYQKKINLTKPKTYRLDLKRMTPNTAYPDIQGIIYEDEMNKNYLMRTDELHKFSDGTLIHVQTALNDITTGLEMDYLPKRKWSKQVKQRACVMINAPNKKLRDKRLMRNLEKFVGGRPYKGDLHSVVVLRYEKRSKSENKGKVPTEMELVLEQTQQGTSYEVSISAEGVEELKRKVKIKGEKKEAILTLRFDTSAGNPIEEILLKLNLPDHRSILMDSKVTPTKHG
ncbi:hypothetical protein Tco_0636788 [Tanacetum coccineum]